MNRRSSKAVLFRFQSAGIPWRDLPERFGDWKIVIYQRFNRWIAKSGAFERVFKLLASDRPTTNT